MGLPEIWGSKDTFRELMIPQCPEAILDPTVESMPMLVKPRTGGDQDSDVFLKPSEMHATKLNDSSLQLRAFLSGTWTTTPLAADSQRLDHSRTCISSRILATLSGFPVAF